MIPWSPRKPPSFGRFTEQNKKNLQVKSTPLRKKEKNISLTLHNLWEKNNISTPPPLWIVTKNEPTSIYVKIVVRECMGKKKNKGQMVHKMFLK
jgi:hypothetical protein